MSKEPKTFRARPLKPYKLMGTDIALDVAKTYDAVWARHIPGWKEKKMIFINNILLEEGEYELMP